MYDLVRAMQDDAYVATTTTSTSSRSFSPSRCFVAGKRYDCPGCRGHFRKDHPRHTRAGDCKHPDVEEWKLDCPGCVRHRRRGHSSHTYKYGPLVNARVIILVTVDGRLRKTPQVRCGLLRLLHRPPRGDPAMTMARSRTVFSTSSTTTAMANTANISMWIWTGFSTNSTKTMASTCLRP